MSHAPYFTHGIPADGVALWRETFDQQWKNANGDPAAIQRILDTAITVEQRVTNPAFHALVDNLLERARIEFSATPPAP